MEVYKEENLGNKKWGIKLRSDAMLIAVDLSTGIELATLIDFSLPPFEVHSNARGTLLTKGYAVDLYGSEVFRKDGSLNIEVYPRP